VFEAGPKPSFLFDLDGTLVDSVYQHVLAWREALAAEGIGLPVWRKGDRSRCTRVGEEFRRRICRGEAFESIRDRRGCQVFVSAKLLLLAIGQRG
jgi:beta-phosphoglucomutase-like phosphatase (HAD superfamily)